MQGLPVFSIECLVLSFVSVLSQEHEMRPRVTEFVGGEKVSISDTAYFIVRSIYVAPIPFLREYVNVAFGMGDICLEGRFL